VNIYNISLGTVPNLLKKPVGIKKLNAKKHCHFSTEGMELYIFVYISLRYIILLYHLSTCQGSVLEALGDRNL
jgi:hypothetical protein